MALTAAPGGENPSAAFLAGQQHGQQLAVKHAAPPVAAKPPVAAPTRKPAATQTAPGSLTLNDLLAQAKALASQDTTAQVDAIKAQQGTYTKQAADRASQVNLASQAAAKLLQGFGLADNTGASYNNAAQVLAGLAGGYSGDLKSTATDAASQVQAQLAGLGAPAGSLKTSTGETANPQALGNVLYGLGGAIPGNLLVTSGQAAAAAQRGLPASTLAFGQQQAAGTLAAGQTQADALNPQIAAATAGLPAATRQYLSALLSAQDQQFNQNLSTAKFGLDQSKFTLQQKVDAFNQQYKVNTLNLKGQSLQLQANKFAQQTLQSDRNYQVTLAGLGLRTEAAQRAALKDEYKLANGGFSVDKVALFSADAAHIATNTLNGFTDPKTGKVYPPTNFGQALAHMRTGYGHGSVPLSIALKAMKQAGWTVPAKYDKLMGGLGQQADPFGSPRGLSTTGGGFLPQGASVTIGRTDQGRDIQTAPGTPIVAPGNGYVVRIGSDPGAGGAHFGPAYPIVHFTTGPYAGQTVYVGHTIARVKAGQHFQTGSTLSVTGNGGAQTGGAPPGWAEIGFAPGGTPGGFGQRAPF